MGNDSSWIGPAWRCQIREIQFGGRPLADKSIKLTNKVVDTEKEEVVMLKAACKLQSGASLCFYSVNGKK